MGNDRQDPDTLIALIFRIVDMPRRTLALATLMVLILAGVSLARLPVVELARSGTLWGGGACVVGLGCLRSGQPGPARGRHIAERGRRTRRH